MFPKRSNSDITTDRTFETPSRKIVLAVTVPIVDMESANESGIHPPVTFAKTHIDRLTTMKTLLLTTIASISACFTLCAVDLKNEDSKTYEVKVHEGAATTNTSISGNTTKYSITSDGKIEVVGVGAIQAQGDTVVVIKDGAISIE